MDWNEEMKRIEKTSVFKLEHFLLDFTEKILEYKNEHSLTDKELATHLGLSKIGLDRVLRVQIKLTIKETVEILNKIGYNLSITESE